MGVVRTAAAGLLPCKTHHLVTRAAIGIGGRHTVDTLRHGAPEDVIRCRDSLPPGILLRDNSSQGIVCVGGLPGIGIVKACLVAHIIIIHGDGRTTGADCCRLAVGIVGIFHIADRIRRFRNVSPCVIVLPIGPSCGNRFHPVVSVGVGSLFSRGRRLRDYPSEVVIGVACHCGEVTLLAYFLGDKSLIVVCRRGVDLDMVGTDALRCHLSAAGIKPGLQPRLAFRLLYLVVSLRCGTSPAGGDGRGDTIGSGGGDGVAPAVVGVRGGQLQRPSALRLRKQVTPCVVGV